MATKQKPLKGVQTLGSELNNKWQSLMRGWQHFAFCWVFNFVNNVFGLFRKKIAILYSQVTMCLVNSFSSDPVREVSL